MSGKYYVTDKNGKRQTVKLIQVSNTESLRKRSPENPANSELAKKPKPAGTDGLNIQQTKFKQIHGLSRVELEKFTEEMMSDLVDQHAKSKELRSKLNDARQELDSMKIKYNHLLPQIRELSSSLTSIQETFRALQTQTEKISCMENNVLQRTPIEFTLQVGRDVALIDLTGDGESTSPNSSEQEVIAEDNSAATEDTGVATVEIPAEASSSQEAHPAALPVLPIIYCVEPSSKAMAPAPVIKSRRMQNAVALTWYMLERDLSAYEQMLVYQVYWYKETRAPASTADWKKLAELSAQPLPMTCFVSECTGGRYYFAVRGIDMQLRVGPFSSPLLITFRDDGITSRNLKA